MNRQIPFVIVTLTILIGCSGTTPNVGVNNGKLMPCPKTPNCVNSQVPGEKHYIQPILFTGTQQEAQDRLIQILESEKRAEVLTTQENYIRAEFTSALFRFVDDVEFYFSEMHADQTVIHIRSSSRVGYSDLGANRKRINQIRSKF